MGGISENSRRIARNTLALYFRMFLLMAVGLFTARVVLNALGVEDRGVYEAVGSIVSMMSIITSSLSTAISRFLTVEIGRNDTDRLDKVFSTAVAIMMVVSAAVIVIAEPAGIWYITNVMNLPEGRTGAALCVFQFSLLTFVTGLLSVPYNAAIIAHERMSAFAVIGIVEGLCKLAVALLMFYVNADKLIFYALLMFLVAVFVRMLYTAYCRHFFPESHIKAAPDKECIRQMAGFAGWNGLSYGVYIVNTQGVTLLVNYFFGVVFNTMRGIAFNVENMVKQFVSNVLTAMNPQITKSYVSGQQEYSYTLACKGSKYAFLIIFALALPFIFEAEVILRLWLGDIVPDGTALFTKLALAGLCMDMMLTPFATLIQASGRIRRFYMATSAVTLLIFPVIWILFKAGAPAYVSYLVFIVIYMVNDVVKLLIIRRETGFPIRMFIRESLIPVIPVTVISVAASCIVRSLSGDGVLWAVAVIGSGLLAVAVSAFAFALSRGEREYIMSMLPWCRKRDEI